jgi:hypothetical protein
MRYHEFMDVNVLMPLLWEVSRQTIIDRDNTRKSVIVRSRKGTGTPYLPAQLQEETSTENLARYFAVPGAAPISIDWASSVLGGMYKVALHSRGLEAWNNGRRGSGADLELAVEVERGQWVDLVLQVKRLDVDSKAPKYAGWNKSTNNGRSNQNADLILWAKREGRTPGMMLYNSLVPPFVSKNCRQNSPGWYSCSAFGGCSIAKRVMLAEAVWDDPRSGPIGWPFKGMLDSPNHTPAGVSLCLYQPLLLRNRAMTPKGIQEHHFPLEHLLHRVRASSGEETVRPDDNSALAVGVVEIDEAGSTVPIKSNPPRWAEKLLRTSTEEASETDVERGHLEEDFQQFSPSVSVVLSQPEIVDS